MIQQSTHRRLGRFLSVLVFSTAFPALQATEPETAKAIPFSELGAKATADYKGDAIGIAATADGATLRTGFQKLAGTVTPSGLRLESTEAEGGSLQLTASAVGRVHGAAQNLPATGSVYSTDKLVSFIRPGLVEEYSVSADGVRQDFIIEQRPAGTTELSVELNLSGATAETVAEGVKLTLIGSGRELAYSRLRVTDARGQPLAAQLLVLSPSRLAVRVEDASAVYPVRIDPTFSDADWSRMNAGFYGTNGSVSCFAEDDAGNLYVGGDFTIIGSTFANRIAKWDGTTWSALGSGIAGSSQRVEAIAVVGDDVYVAGLFNAAGGKPANNIAKWSGTTWSALGLGTNTLVTALAVIGTDLYVGGYFTRVDGVLDAKGIAKWNGAAWSSLFWNGGYDSSNVGSLAVIGDDLYMSGFFGFDDDYSFDTSLQKWDGTSWSTIPVDGSVMDMAEMGTDLYVALGGKRDRSSPASPLVKWDGTALSPLNSGIFGPKELAVVGSDLYGLGNFSTGPDTVEERIAKWNGSTWVPLALDARYVYHLHSAGGNLVASGPFTSFAGISASHMAKWDGSAWSAVIHESGETVSNSVTAMALSGSTLYVAGNVDSGDPAPYLTKWDGSTWSSVGGGVNGTVNALAISGNDLYVVGDFTTAGGISAKNIAKWDGAGWSALGAGLDGNIIALAVSGSNVYAGGNVFYLAAGIPVNNIAKWNGSAWSALGSGMGMDGSVAALAVSGSDLYVGGLFTSASDVPDANVAKWNGTTWSALGSGNPSSGGGVLQLLVNGSSLYAATYSSIAYTSSIAKWNGSTWVRLGSGFQGPINAMTFIGTDLYVGGLFGKVGTLPVNNIAKWNGSAWSAIGSGTDDQVTSLVGLDTRRLFVGGKFITAGNKVSRFLAQLNLAAPLSVSPSSSSLLRQTTSLTISGQGFNAVTPGANTVTFSPTGSGTVTAATSTSLTVTGITGLSVGPLNAVVTTGGLSSGLPVQIATIVNPSFAITGNNIPILNGDNTPSTEDGSDFGSASLLNTQVTRHFVIPNVGTSPLNLTGVQDLIAISGEAVADFTVVTEPDATVAPGESTSFDITFDPHFPGPRRITVTIANNGPVPGYHFDIVGFGAITTPKPQTITFAPPASAFQSESPLTLTATASSGLPVKLTIVSGPGDLVGNNLILGAPGTVKITASQSGGGNYAAALSVTDTIVVKADPTVLTLINLAQTYDGSPKPIDTLGGTSPVITYSIGGVYVPTAPTNAGSYQVKAVDGTVTKTGTLVIAKAVLTVTPDDQRKFAGQPNPTLTYDITGFQNGEDAKVLTKTPVLATTATATSVSGVYPITASGATALNYSFNYQPGSMVVETFAGTYEALLADGTPPLPVAKLSITVPATSKTFTAKLTTASHTAAVSFTGTLVTNPGLENATGTATTNIVVNKVNIPYAINFTLPFNGNVLASATRNAVVLPFGSATDGRKLLILATGKTVNYAGAHTAVLEPSTQIGTPTTLAGPVGAGWATATVSTTGVMTLAGKLGDGTAFTSTLSPDDQLNPVYRLFVQSYVAVRTESYLAGAFTFAPHPNPTSNASLVNRRYVEQAALTWKKTGLPADASYRAGFGPVSTVFMLDPWLAPAAAKAATATTPAMPAFTLAQRLGLTGSPISFGALYSDTGSAANINLPKSLNLSAANLVSVPVPPVNSTKWKTLTFVPTTGTFTGSFELSDVVATKTVLRAVTFSGVLRQPAQPAQPAPSTDKLIGDGHYLLPPLSGTEKTTGEIMFTRP